MRISWLFYIRVGERELLLPGPLTLACLIYMGYHILLPRQDEAETQPLLPLPVEELAGVESFGVEYLFSDSARVSARMLAQHVIEAEEGEEKKTEKVHYMNQGVEIQFLNQAGQAHSTIKADSATFRLDQEIADLYGNVRLANHQGEHLETEELHWDKQKDSVFTDKFVRITTPDKVITGSRGLRANTEFTAYTIYGIQGEIEAPDNGL
ncbi:MAG: LPS export ABC transporter periplasmic protein LptC [Bacteroidetes bacterium]|nr:MAG: LPS export ABC transporter periplasmic protein LptC [Bacteroidota bacterium]